MFNKNLKVATILALLLMLIACQTSQQETLDTSKAIDIADTGSNKQTSQLVNKIEYRTDMMCPMNYDPVCATIKVEGQLLQQTFGNNCTLGTVKNEVVSSVQGACQ